MKRYLPIVALLLAACTTRVVPTPADGVPAVIFDIDGTLTPSKGDFAQVRPGATAVAALYAAKGYAVLYLTARPGVLSDATWQWLTLAGFPQGGLRLAETADDVIHPDRFKARTLKDLGWSWAAAYGDQATDLAAYAAAGIPVEHVYAMRREGEKACEAGPQHECLAGFLDQVQFAPGVEVTP